MTRRERLEAKLEKRREWAQVRARRAEQAFKRCAAATEGIPFGQPILVGHHSEKRHRAALDKADNALRSACESLAMEKHHEGKAGGLAAMLDNAIFSDDPDALEAIAARVAELEAERDHMKAVNAALRKGGWAAVAALVGDERAQRMQARMPHYEKMPFPAYSLTNIGGNIRRLKLRVDEIKKRQERLTGVAAAGGVLIEGTGDYIRVTFDDKPARSVLDDLRAAGFRWGGGSWTGLRSSLPASVQVAP